MVSGGKGNSVTPEAWAQAVQQGDLRQMELLLKQGADIRQKISVPQSGFTFLMTALEYALINKRAADVDFLVKNGAVVDMRDRQLAADAGLETVLKNAQAGLPLGIQPDKPWSRMSETDQKLLEAVETGDCAKVRAVFDSAFWRNEKLVPQWAHLKRAVMTENKPMVRLLQTWGAVASEEDIASLRLFEGHERFIRLLRGYNTPVAEPKPAVTEVLADLWEGRLQDLAGKLPQEWKTVLGKFQALGAPEAAIAGGALRDTFNGAAIKDVDIFMRSRGSERKNRKFLEAVFAEAGLNVKQQIVSDGGYGGVFKFFPDPEVEKKQTSWVTSKKLKESWKVIAGLGKTEYNVIFIHRSQKELPDADFARNLIRGFDFFFCQIAYDAKRIIVTEEFKRDMDAKSIMLAGENPSSLEHLWRLVKKYPDWRLCAKSQQMLGNKKASPPTSGYY